MLLVPVNLRPATTREALLGEGASCFTALSTDEAVDSCRRTAEQAEVKWTVFTAGELVYIICAHHWQKLKVVTASEVSNHILIGQEHAL